MVDLGDFCDLEGAGVHIGKAARPKILNSTRAAGAICISLQAGPLLETGQPDRARAGILRRRRQRVPATIRIRKIAAVVWRQRVTLWGFCIEALPDRS
jgi:hypothetical protein